MSVVLFSPDEGKDLPELLQSLIVNLQTAAFKPEDMQSPSKGDASY